MLQECWGRGLISASEPIAYGHEGEPNVVERGSGGEAPHGDAERVAINCSGTSININFQRPDLFMSNSSMASSDFPAGCETIDRFSKNQDRIFLFIP